MPHRAFGPKVTKSYKIRSKFKLDLNSLFGQFEDMPNPTQNDSMVTGAPVYTTAKQFISQIAFYFLANKIAEDRQKSVLLSLLAPDKFLLLCNLVKPKELDDESVTFDVLKKLLLKHQSPRKCEVVARYEFDTLQRADSETVSNFSVRLSDAAEECDFAEGYRDERLRDRFISGINDPGLLKGLMNIEEKLKFDKVVDKALVFEKVNAGVTQMTQGNVGAAAVSAMPRKSTGGGSFPAGSASFGEGMAGKRKFMGKCFCCGVFGHRATECWFKEKMNSKPASGNDQGGVEIPPTQR